MTAPDPLRNLFAAAPINQLLQLELVASGGGSAEVRARARESFRQEGGLVHGGILTTLADTTAVYALLGDLVDDPNASDRTVTGVELKLNFLRPATPGGEPLSAHARTVRSGRTLGVVRVEVRQGERAVAEGLFTYLFLDAPS